MIKPTKRKPGRPPSQDKARNQVLVKLTDAEKKEWTRRGGVRWLRPDLRKEITT